MPIVESQIDIDAPQEKIFSLAQDYALCLKWDPFLAAMPFQDGAREAAVGVRVRVKAKNGLTMEVENTLLEAPKAVAMKMTRGPFFFKVFAGSWILKKISADITRVFFRYNFSVYPSFLPFISNPIIRKVFQHDIVSRLNGLKHCAERTDILKML
jgi:ribosome-associated toxin RatA of RatAB toxin-antitoxin module